MNAGTAAGRVGRRPEGPGRGRARHTGSNPVT